MAEYTDLECTSIMEAELVFDYLQRELADDEDAPQITAVVHKGCLRVTYHNLERDSKERLAWDMQLMGFRDGIQHIMG